MLLRLPAEVQAQGQPPLTATQAQVKAQEWLDERLARQALPRWNQPLALEPVLYYDLALEPKVYVLSVFDEDTVVGYIVVDLIRRMAPVLEFGPVPPPHLQQIQRQTHSPSVEGTLDAPIYAGPLQYYHYVDNDRYTDQVTDQWIKLNSGQITQRPDFETQEPAPENFKPVITSHNRQPAERKVLSGMSDYEQFWGTSYGYSFNCLSGCTPTGAAALLSYWDTQGYPNLISANWRDDVNWMRSYAGGNCNGVWTTTDIGKTGLAMDALAAAKGYDFFDVKLWYPSTATYEAYCQEIDKLHPVLIHMITLSKEYGHTVTGMGYDNGSGQYMIVYDNYDAKNGEKLIQYEVQYEKTYMHRVIPAPVPPTGNECLSPLYRYWNNTLKRHFYTADWSELEGWGGGWAYEKPEGYVATNTECHAEAQLPLYRFWHDQRQKHFYTASENEAAQAMRDGYTLERVVGYVLPQDTEESERTAPLYRLYNAQLDDHFYTTQSSERDIAITQHGYIDQGMIAYVHTEKALLPQPPLAPSNLTAMATSPTKIYLFWTDNSADETGFKIERSLDNAEGWTEIARQVANAQSAYITNHDCETTYYYRVRAYNADNDSDYSNITAVTTLECIYNYLPMLLHGYQQNSFLD